MPWLLLRSSLCSTNLCPNWHLKFGTKESFVPFAKIKSSFFYPDWASSMQFTIVTYVQTSTTFYNVLSSCHLKINSTLDLHMERFSAVMSKFVKVHFKRYLLKRSILHHEIIKLVFTQSITHITLKFYRKEYRNKNNSLTHYICILQFWVLHFVLQVVWLNAIQVLTKQFEIAENL